MSLSRFETPHVGCQSFRTVVNHIRSDNNTLQSGLDDIIDNIWGIANAGCLPGIICNINMDYNENLIHRISISDNIPHGFKKIFDNGSNNPLNMGHIRSGHSDDNESSEFGTGLKKAIIYNADEAEIYTRAELETGEIVYVKVVFDIPMMCKKEIPEESYEPSSFEIITEQQYRKHHPYEVGSTIIMKHMRPYDFTFDHETNEFQTQETFENKISATFKKLYSDLIQNEVFSIKFNGKNIEPEQDIINLVPTKNINKYKIYVELNPRGGYRGDEPANIYIEYQTADRNIRKCQVFDKKTSKFEFIETYKVDELILNNPNICQVILKSITTYGTEYDEIQHGDYTDICRDGRCFEPSLKITKFERDGYSNHIYSKIKYTSKRLNRLLGVGPNKRVERKNNMLMTVISLLLKKNATAWRKFCKDNMKEKKTNEHKQEETMGSSDYDSDSVSNLNNDINESNVLAVEEEPIPIIIKKPKLIIVKEPEPVITEEVKEESEPVIVEDVKEEPKPVIVEDVKEEPKPVITEEVKEEPEPVITEEVKEESEPVIVEDVKEEPKSIVVEEVKEESEPIIVEEVKEEPKPIIVEEVKEEPKPIIVEEVKEEPKPIIVEEVKEDPKPIIVEEVKEESEPIIVEEVKEDPKPIIVEEVKEDPKPIIVEEVKEESEPIIVEEVKEESEPIIVEEVKEDPKPIIVEEVKEDPKPIIVEEVKEDPKPIIVEEPVIGVSTEELIQEINIAEENKELESYVYFDCQSDIDKSNADIKKAISLLQEYAHNPTNRVDGKILLDFVLNYLNISE